MGTTDSTQPNDTKLKNQQGNTRNKKLPIGPMMGPSINDPKNDTKKITSVHKNDDSDSDEDDGPAPSGSEAAQRRVMIQI